MRKIKGLLIPVVGEVLIRAGGDTEDVNHHHASRDQRFAFDMVACNKAGKSHRGRGRANQDYYIFGREVICPLSGRVVEAIDGVRDNTPGKTNIYSAVGNCVVVQHDSTTFSILAHLKQDSVVVERGRKLKAGDPIGLCGNSGHSTGPHLHFHLQNKAEIGKGWGIKCYFGAVVMNGDILHDYSPVKDDVLRNSGAA